MQGEIVARSMLDSDFFVVTLLPLGYFDIDSALYVWRYKGTKNFRVFFGFFSGDFGGISGSLGCF